MKKFAVVKSENVEIIEAIRNKFSDKCVLVDKNDDLSNFELVVLTGFETSFEGVYNGKILNLYPALLPAFKCENTIQEVFLSGVKVSGVTVHFVESENFYGRIIAQYPILLGLTTHFDEFYSEIIELSKKFYPSVIDAIFNDKLFDFSDLLKSSCNSSCSKHENSVVNPCENCKSCCK